MIRKGGAASAWCVGSPTASRPRSRAFLRAKSAAPSSKYGGGKSKPGLAHYFVPCTPRGDWHHYTFTLIASDLDPKALEPGAHPRTAVRETCRSCQGCCGPDRAVHAPAAPARAVSAPRRAAVRFRQASRRRLRRRRSPKPPDTL